MSAPANPVRPAGLAERIDDLLPQTQCGQCGYGGCEPYARAIAAGEAAINRCPPGGESGVRALAELTGQPALPLDTACGAPVPFALARIDEPRCIGCALCLGACPVDAIVGARRYLHTVIPELCTGCGLCLPPCPVDCIDMTPPPPALAAWTRERADAARERHRARAARLARRAEDRRLRIDARDADPAQRRATVQSVVERARARRREASAPVDKP